MFNPIIAGRLSSLESGGFSKTTKVVVADKAEVIFADFGENNLYISNGINIMQAGLLTEGTPITVHFDGINYANEVKNVNDSLVFGNLSLAGVGGDTGEPFIGTVNIENGNGFVSLLTSLIAEAHIVGISATVKTDYICALPVVELTIPHNLANAELTPKEAQMMWELNGGMCVFKVNYIDGGMTATGIPHVAVTEDGCEYMLEFNGVQYLVDNYVGIWMFKLSFGE